jgi:hypothetical protein
VVTNAQLQGKKNSRPFGHATFALSRTLLIMPKTTKTTVVFSRHFRCAADFLFVASSLPQMGVEKEIITAGDGVTFPKRGQELTMHYTGTLLDGTVFDSSVRKGRPFKFKIGIGAVIRGWDEGVMTMTLGEKSKLTITGDFAYGEDGIEGVIPQNATLLFEVELLACGEKPAAASSCALL